MATSNGATSSNDYDMIVVGGGIYGAAVLWEAAHRGLRVLLLEKNDFCSGTSANSLKTIHGGIRYLQSLNVKRTIDSDREKVILKKIAPNIVEPLTCTLPATNLTTKSYLSFFAATKIFNFLSKLNPLGSGRNKDVFSPSSVRRKFTIFNKVKNSKPTQSSMVWQDAQVTNSEHLPLAFIRSAVEIGGTAMNYAEVSSIQQDGFRYLLRYQTVAGSIENCSASYVVDCSAGQPLLESEPKLEPASADYVSGLNIILNEQFSDYAYALAVNSFHDGKQGLLFFSPWKGYTIAGTWYYKKSEISNRDQIDHSILFRCVNDIVSALADGGVSIEASKILSMVEDIHLGFLPADLSKADPEKSIIERAIVKQRSTGYFELRGNKYTTARLNAKKLLDRIAQGESKIKASRSHLLPLAGLSIASSTTQKLFEGSVVWNEMLTRYGELAADFSSLISAESSILELVTGSADIYRVEVEYFAQHDQTQQLADLLYRRLNINVHKPISEQTITWCAQRMAVIKQWSEATRQSNLNEVLERERWKAGLKNMLGQQEMQS